MYFHHRGMINHVLPDTKQLKSRINTDINMDVSYSQVSEKF